MQKKILLIGDSMLDKYCFGLVKRISPEAPVPILLEKKAEQKSVLGGAANVAVNLRAAGLKVEIMSIVGNDDDGLELLRILQEEMIGTTYMMIDNARKTTTKLRYIGQNSQQILRVDNETTDYVKAENYLPILDKLSKNIEEIAIIVLSDYAKGLLSAELIYHVKLIAKAHQIPIIADVKGNNRDKYRELFLIKPNRFELEELMGQKAETLDEITELAVQLCEKINGQYVLVTCGENGMILVDKRKKLTYIPSEKKEVFDVTGAGDTVLAYLAAGLAQSFDLIEILKMANIAAGIQVSKTGTSPVSLHEVQEELHKRIRKQTDRKIIPLEAVAEYRMGIRGSLVFTNGCFDILHIGHIDYLRKASQLGSKLMVGINSDASVKRLKGASRPINNERQRSEVIAALEFVDYVVIFEEDTPYRLIKAVIPDILVKGGDYMIEDIVGRDIVVQNGGKVVTIPLVEGISTTGMIKKIEKR